MKKEEMYLENVERCKQLILWSFPAYADKDLELRVHKLNSMSFSDICSFVPDIMPTYLLRQMKLVSTFWGIN